jgi:hypothetical protein
MLFVLALVKLGLGPQKLIVNASRGECVARCFGTRINTQPRAIGRSGAAIHSLHEPGYRRDPGRPAMDIANTL